MNEKEHDKITKDINLKVFKQQRECFIDGCNKMAVKCHLLQRNGILNHIISNGHLHEVSYLQYPKGHYTIKRIGWKDALTFYGFCAEHDSGIFEPIEKKSIDFSDYRNCLLLSFRPLVYEYRLKEIVSEA